jgi:putative Mg2+ transporter-C (MgtC) family protein
VGIGFWFPAILGAVSVLLVLAIFRVIEEWLPSEFYAHHMLRFERDRVMGEADVQKMIRAHGFTIANLSSRLTEGGKQFEYRMTIKSDWGLTHPVQMSAISPSGHGGNRLP